MYSLAEIIERLSQSMQEHEDRVVRESVFANLSLTQIHYLDAIRHFEKYPTVSQLAEHLDVSKPTVTNALERLELGGYIRKVHSSEDHRVWYVHLTPTGLKIADLHDEIHRGYAENFTKALSGDEITQLNMLLNKVLHDMGL